jgi:hypothetical protein
MTLHSHYDITPLLARLDRLMPARRSRGRVPGTIERPPSFTMYHDPLDRFELHYPAEWDLRAGAAPAVMSPTLGAFARVDLLPANGELWLQLKQRLPGLHVSRLRPGSPERAEGILPSASRSFAWSAFAFELRGLRIVLSTGRVVDDAPPALAAYRRRILAGIRRQFRLAPGLRSDRDHGR